MASADVHNAHWVDKQSRPVFAGEVDAYVTKPRLLDLFCGAGGCARGYQLAGFYVVGVDNRPQPRYAGDEFVQADALEYVREHGHEFDAIHASPPCQHFSAITKVSGRSADHPDLLKPVRQVLIASGAAYVIENVVRAPLHDPVTLCAAALGLSIVEDGTRYVLRRHRLFEANFPVMVPPCACWRGDGTTLGIYGGGTRQDTRKEANPGGGNTQKANARQAKLLMETPWMTRQEMTQAIPPAYTALIGGFLLAEVRRRSLGRAA